MVGAVWAPAADKKDVYEGRDRKTGAPKWTGTRVDLIFGSHSQLRAFAEVHGQSDSQAKFVKAFNSVGSAFMVNPPFKPQATMFICGNDAGAKTQVSGILTRFGWHIVDMGAVEAARPIEALCQLWCTPGLNGGDWQHAIHWMKL